MPEPLRDFRRCPGDRLCYQTNDIVAFRREEFWLFSEFSLVSRSELFNRLSRSRSCENVGGALRRIACLPQHLRILDCLGRKKERLLQMNFAGLLQHRDRVRRIRPNQDSLRVCRLDLVELSAQVRRSLRVWQLDCHRSTQLREPRLERGAAADAAFIVDVEHRELTQSAIAIEVFRKNLSPHAAGGNDAKDEIPSAGQFWAGRSGADQNDFARFGQWSKRQGDTAAHGPEYCNRRLCACHDPVERRNTVSRTASIILHHKREAATADAARTLISSAANSAPARAGIPQWAASPLNGNTAPMLIGTLSAALKTAFQLRTPHALTRQAILRTSVEILVITCSNFTTVLNPARCFTPCKFPQPSTNSKGKKKSMEDKVTLIELAQMKRDGKKSVGVVAWDYQIARIAERAGVDFISVGDSVGVNLLGHANPLEVTLDEMLVCLQGGAPRRGARAGELRRAVRPGAGRRRQRAARRHPPRQGRRRRHGQGRRRGRFSRRGARARPRRHSGVRAVRAHAADRAEIRHPLQRAEFAGAQATAGDDRAKLVEEAKLLEDAGASLLDFTNSGPVAGAAVVKAVKIPVIGGFGGGPWLDGRVRLAHTAIGYAERWIDAKTETYFNGAKATLDAFTALIADVRAGRQIKG